MLPLIGALLSAGVSAAGIGMQASAQQDANAINWRNVLETIRANREREQMAQADRADAYGNKITYDDYSGFGFDLTPITEAILGAQQREQLASLREDAPRNRAAAERMDERSQLGDEQFRKVFNEYKYRPKANEQELVGDAQQLLLNSRSRGLAEAANTFARQLLRTGNTSNVSKVYKQAGDDYAASLSDAMLQAKRIGREDYQNREASDLQRYTGELGFLKSVADTTTTSPVANPTYNQELSGRADQALSELLGVTGQNVGSMQSAYNNAAQSFGQSPDVSGLASALAKINFGGSIEKTSPSDGSGNMYDAAGNKIDPWLGLRTATI